MIICPRCGTQNPPDAAKCLLCESALPAASVPPAAAVSPDSTADVAERPGHEDQLAASPSAGQDVPTPGAPPPPAEQSAPRMNFGQTLALAAADRPAETQSPAPAPVALGQTLVLPPAAADPADDVPPTEASPRVDGQERSVAGGRAPSTTLVMTPQRGGSALRSTVLGLGVPDPAGDTGKRAPIAARGPAGTLMSQAPRNSPFQGKTMLGLAPERLAAQTPPGSPHDVPGTAGQPHTRTILGVARPGIAPIHPGVHKPDAAESPFPAPPPPPPPQTTTALATASAAPGHVHLPTMPIPPTKAPPGARTMTLRAARKSSLFGALAIGAAALSLLIGGALYFYFASPSRIEARVVLDPEGRERILLRCSGCQDGTVVRLAGVRATFKSQQAALDVPQALQVGETPFTLGIQAPDSQRENNVSLNVRIDYRVRADLAGLSEPVPKVRVLVDAIPGSLVSVDERPVALSATGQARVDFDVSKELTGLDGSVRRLERRITYSVTPKGSAKQTGQVIVQLGIAPLIVDAPGSTITIESATFVLAGRTAKGGSVTVEGRPLRVDAEGRFAQVMNVSSVGETTISVRAVAPEHAPRLFPIRVRRVTSFAEEAQKLRAQSTTSYAGIADDIDSKRGWKVALDGIVLERSAADHSTVLLFEATSGCRAAPCLARVTYGARSDVAKGERVSVFGEVQGSVDGPKRDTKIPEVLADFVLRAKR